MSKLFFTFSGDDIRHHLLKVRSTIEMIFKTCNKSYSQALLISSKSSIGIHHFLILNMQDKCSHTILS